MNFLAACMLEIMLVTSALVMASIGDAANDIATLRWCQKPDTILLYSKCMCACISKFEKNYCSFICDQVKQPKVRDVTSSTGQDCKPCDFQGAWSALDVITEYTCPNGTYYKCLPYGACYDFQSYCSDRSRSVNSCFPANIVGNNKDLLVWCIEQITSNITWMPHPACKLACVDKFGIAALYQSPSCQNGTTLDDITESTSPDGTCHNCLPNGNCNNFQSYYIDKSRPVNSCFPDNILGNNERLLVWCQEQITSNITQMPHPSCKFACVDKFGIAALYQSQNENSADNKWALWTTAVLAICLLASIVFSIVKWCKAARQHNAAIIEAETPGGNNQIPRCNNKDSLTYQNRLMKLDLKTSWNLDQPALNDFIVSSNIWPNSVQDSSTTNSQIGSPMNQLHPGQGRSTSTQNGGSMTVTDNNQSSVNFQGGQAIYSLPARDPVASFSSVYIGGDHDGTSEESSALIPRNHATESGDKTSPIHTPDDLHIHASTTTIPGAEGSHPVTEYE